MGHKSMANASLYIQIVFLSSCVVDLCTFRSEGE